MSLVSRFKAVPDFKGLKLFLVSRIYLSLVSRLMSLVSRFIAVPGFYVYSCPWFLGFYLSLVLGL